MKEQSSLSKNGFLQFGVGLIILSGVIPFFVGFYNYFDALLLYSDVQVDPMIRFLQHVGNANLILTGLTLALLAQFGVRRKIKWAWWASVVIIVWVGVNDSIAFILSPLFIEQDRIPAPIIPTLIGFVGLSLSFRNIFKSNLE